MRQETIAKMLSDRVIVIVRGLSPDRMEGLAEALFAGGASLMEVTFDQSRPETWKGTAAAIAMLSDKFAGRILPGAGTVLTRDQASLAFDAGARYIISPNVEEAVITATRSMGMVSLPGALTPTEIVRAREIGADFVKVFPAGSLGVSYIKAIRAPLPHIPLMAVGGVSETNAAEFIKAGVAGVGVGGNLCNKEWIERGEWDKITALCAQYMEAVKLA